MLMFHGREQISLGLAAVLGRKPQYSRKGGNKQVHLYNYNIYHTNRKYSSISC